jgi:hypothetical protein
MSSNLSAPRSLFGGALASREDKAAGKQFATIRHGAFLERTEDEAQLYLALAKMHDIGIATRHSFEEGEDMVADFRRRVGDDPLVAKALSPFLEDGLQDLNRVRRRLSQGF